MFSKVINNLILTIFWGQLENKKIIFYPNINLVKEFLFVLYSEGLIGGFSLVNKKYKISLKYSNNSPVIRRLKIFKKKNFKNSITHSQLLKLSHKNPSSLFILNTNLGFLSHTSALRLLSSGHPICKLN